MEIVYLVVCLLQRAKEWGRAVAVAVCDVRKALDSIDHDALLDSLLSAECPLQLAAVCLLELSDTFIDVVVGGACTPSGSYLTRGVGAKVVPTPPPSGAATSTECCCRACAPGKKEVSDSGWKPGRPRSRT